MSDAAFSLFTSLRYDVDLKQVPAKGLQYAGWNYKNESPFYMLDLHRDRILKAATHWKWKEAIEKFSDDEALHRLAKMAQDFIGASETKPLRLRILVNSEGSIRFERFDTPMSPVGNLLPERLTPPGTVAGPNEPQVPPCYTLVVDDSPLARSEFTHYKTTRRAMYDTARSRANIGPFDSFKEVLIINQDDKTVMEGSTTTPYFWRDDRWITPPVSAKFSWKDGSGGQDGTTRRWALERGLAVEHVVPVDSLTEGEECWISNGVGGFRRAVVSLTKDN
ncbi:hypothetical protein TOPH_08304 [Tolypocladium ophioglossoides CBS 100239]|uniref:Aminodeoxychorismate lyase n=1 Tax=Tolypocladium ophioglossoides (strain CBS 100239) TaxID=1163406 RepID=A0A0L0MZ48_TOLOC|nr:hypothetical protein TOPH_08304 [Tolypocladium ophioglossoides CBS 100239]